jgi:hypothetical protein
MSFVSSLRIIRLTSQRQHLLQYMGESPSHVRNVPLLSISYVCYHFWNNPILGHTTGPHNVRVSTVLNHAGLEVYLNRLHHHHHQPLIFRSIKTCSTWCRRCFWSFHLVLVSPRHSCRSDYTGRGSSSIPAICLFISVGSGRCLVLCCFLADLYGCLRFCSSRHSVFKKYIFCTSQISYCLYITKTGLFYFLQVTNNFTFSIIALQFNYCNLKRMHVGLFFTRIFLDYWSLKMGPICCSETSVRNCHYLLRKCAVLIYFTADAWNHT